jgi:hypothetical protein
MIKIGESPKEFLIKKSLFAESVKMNQIYHLRSDNSTGLQSFTRCNQKSSEHWIKYHYNNFMQQKVYNTQMGKEVPIVGQACLRCTKLIRTRSN